MYPWQSKWGEQAEKEGLRIDEVTTLIQDPEDW